ncbi:MAG: hypothetical protein AAGI30_13150 [Planctomycetota bacterium]
MPNGAGRCTSRTTDHAAAITRDAHLVRPERRRLEINQVARIVGTDVAGVLATRPEP